MKFFTIFSREIKSYFNSPIAYIFIIVFLLISTGIFMNQFFILQAADMRAFFEVFPIILCIFIPAITMRLWAEDKKTNTIELLLTFPIKTYQLVLGKYFASLVFYLISLISTATLPMMVFILGKPDVGVIFTQYLGSVLLGAFFLSLGIFISGFCKDQIVSFVLSMMVCFFLFLLGTEFIASSIDGWIPQLGSFLKDSLGIAQRILSFEKGVVDLRDVMYFLAGIFIFLVLNSIWMDTRLRPKAKINFGIGSCIMAGIFILFNYFFSDTPLKRFDFTREKVYTLSEVSPKILKSLKSPVLVKLFISPSDKMPTGLKTLERQIKDKLDELKISSGGNFRYKIFHVEAAKVAQPQEESLEKSLERKGIRPFQVRSIERDTFGVKLIYSAVSIAYKERPEEIIPRILPVDLPNLEYILISKIYKMTLSEKPKVALVAPYEEKILPSQIREVWEKLGKKERERFIEDRYSLANRLLEYEGYDVERIKLTEEEPIPEDTKTLIVLEPRQFNERQRFEINRFLVNGGSVLLAVQKYTFNYYPFGYQGLRVSAQDNQPKFNSLLQNWGLKVDEDFLMDNQNEVISLTSEGRLFGIFEVSSPVKLPIQIKIVPAQMNKDLSITSNLSQLLYLWGTALDIDFEKLKNLGLKADVLFTSSPYSWKVKYHSGYLKKEDIFPLKDTGFESFPLAVFVRGQFPDVFKDKEIPSWPENEQDENYEGANEVKINPQSGKLILFGCATMFDRRLFDKGSHLNLFINSVDVLTLGEDLVKIRSKGMVRYFIKKISTQAKVFWRIFTTFFIPSVLFILGILKSLRRRHLKYSYLKTLS